MSGILKSSTPSKNSAYNGVFKLNRPIQVQQSSKKVTINAIMRPIGYYKPVIDITTIFHMGLYT